MPQIIEYDKSQLPKSLEINWSFESELSNFWLELVPESIKSISAKRVREFAASRKALAQLCQCDNFEEIEIINNSHLKSRPNTKVSLSHTRGISAAVISTEHQAVGIDVEFAQREFKDAVSKFFKLEQDLAIPTLELWSIKEAAFKAFEPLKTYKAIKETLVLKDLVVTNQHIVFNQEIVAQWNCQKHDGLITAVAWI